jgi:methionyl-tRNA formyltransferase
VVEPIGPRDTSGALLTRLASSGAGLLVKVLDAIGDGSAKAVAQPNDGVSFAPKITVADAEVRWSEPAFAVDRRVRACTPAPGAWTAFRGERVKISPVRPARTQVPLEPGQVAVGKDRVLVGTATEPVELGPVRPAGRKEMSAVDWARGARIVPAERLGVSR